MMSPKTAREPNPNDVALPSNSIAGEPPIEVKDARGRAIKLRKPKILEQFRLTDALGESAKNEAYFGMAFPLLFVVSIDGALTPTPATKGQVEALLQRLDYDGLEAVNAGIMEHFAVTNPAEEAAETNA